MNRGCPMKLGLRSMCGPQAGLHGGSGAAAMAGAPRHAARCDWGIGQHSRGVVSHADPTAAICY